MLDAIEAIENYLKGGYCKPLSTIKEEIAAFVLERDKNDATSTYVPYRTEPTYYVREGRVIYRDKLKDE